VLRRTGDTLRCDIVARPVLERREYTLAPREDDRGVDERKPKLLRDDGCPTLLREDGALRRPMWMLEEPCDGREETRLRDEIALRDDTRLRDDVLRRDVLGVERRDVCVERRTAGAERRLVERGLRRAVAWFERDACDTERLRVALRPERLLLTCALTSTVAARTMANPSISLTGSRIP